MNKCKTKQIEIYEEQKWTKLGLHVIGSAFHTLKNKRMEMNADKRLTKKIIKTGITCNEWLATFQFSTILYKFRISNFFPSFPFCLGRQRSDPAHDLCTEAKGSSSQALGRSCSKGVFGILPSLAGGGGGWDEHTPNAYEGLLHWYLPPTDTCRNSISSAFVFVFAAALCSRVLLRVFFSNSLRLSSQRTKDRLLSEWVYHMTRCSETHLGGWGLQHLICSSMGTHLTSNECNYAYSGTSHVHLAVRERESESNESLTPWAGCSCGDARVADAGDRQTTLITRQATNTYDLCTYGCGCHLTRECWQTEK